MSQKDFHQKASHLKLMCYSTGKKKKMFAGVFASIFLPGNVSCWGSEGVNQAEARSGPSLWNLSFLQAVPELPLLTDGEKAGSVENF